MRRDAGQVGRGEFFGLPASEEQIDGAVTGEMTALDQKPHPMFLLQNFAGEAHLGMGLEDVEGFGGIFS